MSSSSRFMDRHLFPTPKSPSIPSQRGLLASMFSICRMLHGFLFRSTEWTKE
uniref:Uncharacterized protein n=1 Tax=Rhizophora mucronata TaxID=61149 RepID=A0A2P2PUI9_RHIMU